MPGFARHLSIGLKIAAGFGLILALLSATGGWTTLSLFASLERFAQYREVAGVSVAAGEVRTEFQAAHMAAEAYILTVDYGQQADAEKRLKSALEQTAKARAASTDASVRERLTALETGIVGFDKLFRESQGNAFLQQEMAVKLREAGKTIDATAEKLALELAGKLDSLGPQVQASLSEAARVALWLTGFAILAGIATSVLLSRSLGRPIRQMTEAMRRIAAGDLAAPIPAQDRGDEIGGMAQALSVFKDNAERVSRLRGEQEEQELRSTQARRGELNSLADHFESSVKAVVERVGTASRELATSADGLIATAAAANDETGHVARQAAQSAANVATVASASEELSASIGEIAAQAGRSATVARDAESRSRETSRTVTELSEAAQRIGQVVTLISTIAEQTNLLALNATIEAARAGEAGRGFAVVAQEVKSLAGQTARATQDIGAQIHGIQTATTDAVEAIRAVAEAIAEVSGIAATIAASVEEQRAVVDEITRSTTQVSVSTQAVNASIDQVREGAVTTMGAAEQSRHAAQALGGEAHQLEEEVRSFLTRVRVG